MKQFSDECNRFESTSLLNIEQNSSKLENLHNRNFKSEAYLPAKFVANYENVECHYQKGQTVQVCETTAKDKTHWRVEKSVELIPAIYLMLPGPDPQAKQDALELRKQYGQIQECWELRNRRARQVTCIMRLKSKITVLERAEFSSFCEEYETWKVTLIPQCDNELKQLEVQLGGGILDRDLHPEVIELRGKFDRIGEKFREFSNDREQGK